MGGVHSRRLERFAPDLPLPNPLGPSGLGSYIRSFERPVLATWLHRRPHGGARGRVGARVWALVLLAVEEGGKTGS